MLKRRIKAQNVGNTNAHCDVGLNLQYNFRFKDYSDIKMAAVLIFLDIQDRLILTSEIEISAKIHLQKVFLTLITSSAMTPQRERTS